MFGPLKSIGVSAAAAVYAAKLIIQLSITAQYTMRPFVKIIRPLVTSAVTLLLVT